MVKPEQYHMVHAFLSINKSCRLTRRTRNNYKIFVAFRNTYTNRQTTTVCTEMNEKTNQKRGKTKQNKDILKTNGIFQRINVLCRHFTWKFQTINSTMNLICWCWRRSWVCMAWLLVACNSRQFNGSVIHIIPSDTDTDRHRRTRKYYAMIKWTAKVKAVQILW